MRPEYAYGHWILAVFNSALFIAFAFAYFRPRTRTDWRTLGAFSAFVVALFTEMYGFPLTIYLLSGWLIRRNPNVDLFSHQSGHLWSSLLGVPGDAHFTALHLLSSLLIFSGLALLSSAWRVLLAAQRAGELATSGPYARLRHPQYAAFGIIMTGFLLQWPTLPTLVMFPILIVTYVRLARREELQTALHFGSLFNTYKQATPALIPHLRRVARPVDTRYWP